MNSKNYVYDNKFSALSDADLMAYAKNAFYSQNANELLSDAQYLELKDFCNELNLRNM